MKRTQPRFSFLRGFTLVEVMLSLFIALILLVGMNSIFRTTSETIRAGQQLSEFTRNSRAVQPILYGDFRDAASDSPAFVITSCVVPQYLNKADATATQNLAATLGLPNGGLPTSGCELGDHLHRSDMVMFFARGQFKRKTADSPANGGTGYLVSATVSDEAYIHYGHLRMLSSDGVTYIGPDDYAGNSEPYAADWVLGRNVMLMMARNSVNNGLLPAPQSSNPAPNSLETYYAYTDPVAGTAPLNNFANPWGSITNPSGTPPTLYPANMTPLGFDSPDYNPNSNKAFVSGVGPESSRYDLAGASIDQFRSTVTNSARDQATEMAGVVSGGIPNTLFYFWWAPLIYAQPHVGIDTTVNTGNPGPFPYTPLVTGAVRFSPFSTLPYFTSTVPANPVSPFPRNRFKASSILSTTPMTSQDQANLSPIFLEHVSQFIVEFAGDFVTQDNSTATTSGDVTDTAPDGQIDWVYATKGDWQTTTSYLTGDYVIVPTGGGQCTYYYAIKPSLGQAPASSPTFWSHVLLTGPVATNPFPPPSKAIRWYGMPRDSSGSQHVWSYYGINNASGVSTNDSANELNNVVPLLDVWYTSANNINRPVPNEVETGPALAPQPQNLTTFAKIYDYALATAPQGMSPQGRYTAVWQNDVPAMVRIIYKVDDPNNGLKDGPTYECVFKLK